MKASCRTRVAMVAILAATAGSARAAERGVDPRRVAEHLAAAIRFRTVSHQDHAQDDDSQWRGLRSFLERTYPRVHRALAREIVNGNGLLYRWTGSDASAPPVLLMAHQDVVPVEPESQAAWEHPPFDGVISDGFVWGRGTIDDKASLVFLMEAVESLLVEGFRPRRTVYVASGSDEEVGGRRGAAEIATLLASRHVHLEYVLDEGGAILEGVTPGVREPVASIGVAEKGFVSVELVATAEGGHSSMPPRETAVGLLAAAIDRLDRHPMCARLRGAPRAALARLAPYMPFGTRIMLSNLWLFGPLVTRRLEETPATNAWVRTTTAPTILQAGVKENVLPSRARAVVNFRILQGDSVADVLEHVRKVVRDDRIAIAKLPETVSEPSAESSTASPAYRLIERTIHDLYPDALPSPALVVGATDSRWFGPLADDVYRFAPLRLGRDDLKRFHGTNERLPVDQVGTAVEFYRRVLRERQ